VRSLIYIFAYVFVPVIDCTCVRIGCATRLPPPSRRPSFPAVLTCFVWREVIWPLLCSNWGRDFSTLSSQTLLNKDRQCCESWRDAELGVRAVCAVGATTDEDRWVDLLCCSPHSDTAENDTLTTFSSSSKCYDNWRRPSPTVRRPSYNASSPFRRCRLLRSCHNTSAAQRLLLAASYIFLVTFSVLYYGTLFFFVVPLSISQDTVLSHNYCITPAVIVIFWFQSCLVTISRFPHVLTAES